MWGEVKVIVREHHWKILRKETTSTTSKRTRIMTISE